MTHRNFRYLLFCLTGLVFLCIGLTLTVIVFNPNILKPVIEQWVKRNTQRVLTINGDIQIDVYPHIEIQLNNLVLSEYQREQHQFVTIEAIYVMADLGSLLNQQVIAIDRVVVTGVSAQLVRDKDGVLNIDDLLNQPNETTPTAIEIAQAEIIRGQLSIQDEMTQQYATFDDIHLGLEQITRASIERAVLQTSLQLMRKDQRQQMDLVLQFEAREFKLNETIPIGGPVVLSIQNSAADQDLNVNLIIDRVMDIESSSKVEFQAHMRVTLMSEFQLQTARIELDTIMNAQSAGQRWRFSDLEIHAESFHPDYLRKPIHGRLAGDIEIELPCCIQTKLHGTLADSTLTIAALADMSAEPGVSFDVRLTQIDLNEWLAESTLKPEQMETARQAELSENSLTEQDFSFLKTNYLKGIIQIGTLTVDTAQLSNIRMIFAPGVEVEDPKLKHSIQ